MVPRPAGFKVGDVIVSIDGKKVPDANALRFRIATLSIGRQARIGAIRNGKPLRATGCIDRRA